MKAYKTLFVTELKLSLRGMDMVIFALCLPVVITVILGIIYGNKPAFDGADYSFLAQSFGAVASVAICAGGVMGLPLVVSDYRGKGILRRFRITPVSPVVLLAAHVTIYAAYSVVSLVLVYLTAFLCFGYRMPGSPTGFAGAYALVMLSVFSMGMMVGGIAKNQKSAGLIASALYFPMLIFSGATLPYEIMPKVLRNIADFLPLTQGIKLLKAASLGQKAVLMPVIIMAALAAACIAVSIKCFKWD